MTWHAGQDLQRLERKSVFIYLFAMGQFLAAQLQPYIKGTFYVALHKEEWVILLAPKAFKFTKKRDNRQMSSKTWQKIWSAALKITDLRKCLFWKTTCQSGTSPLASKLRYAINSIKSKQRCHLNTQRTYFTPTIKMFLPYCFVLNWNLSKLVYPAEFFNFAESSFFQ